VSKTSVILYDGCMSEGKKLTASGVGMLALPDSSMVAKRKLKVGGVSLQELRRSLYNGARRFRYEAMVFKLVCTAQHFISRSVQTWAEI
jgi:hypothetical protein